MKKIKAIASETVIDLNLSDRHIGQMVSLNIDNEIGESGNDCAADLFQMLFKANPQLKEEVSPDRETNRLLLSYMEDTTSFEQARIKTKNNIPVAAATTTTMYEALKDEEALKEAMRKQERAEEAEKQAREKDAQANGFDAAGIPDTATKLRLEAENLKKFAQNLAAEAANDLAKALEEDLPQAAIQAACQSGAKTADDIAQAIASWGNDGGQAIKTDPTAAQTFLEKYEKKITDIARFAGRMKGLALSEVKNKSRVSPIATQVDMTKNIPHLFMTEAIKLSSLAPDLVRATAMSGLATNGLLGWTPTSEGKEEGPFVAAVDVSGSMGGEREITAKGTALGLAKAHRTQTKAEYGLFTFGSETDQIYSVTSEEDWMSHLEWAKNSVGAGTSFNKAIREGLAMIRNLPHSENADFVIISDGEAIVSPDCAADIAQEREATGLRLYYINVGNRSTGSLEKIADEVINISDFTEEAAEQITKKLAVRNS